MCTKSVVVEKNILFIWRGRILYAGVDGYTTEPHQHYAASLLIGLDAPLTLRVDDAVAQPRCVLLGPNLYHQSLSSSRVIVLQLDPDSEWYEPIGRWLGSAGYREIPYDRLAAFEHRFGELYLEMLDCAGAERLYHDLLENLWGPRPERPPIDERIARLIEELKTELPDQIGVAELAQRVGLSEDRFMHVFKSEMGLPVRRYLLWLRLHQAARLMTDGVTLTEAAHAAGFSDSAHMSRTFKDNFGVPPSSFLGPNQKNVKVTICTDD